MSDQKTKHTKSVETAVMVADPNNEPTPNEELQHIVRHTTAAPETAMVGKRIGKDESAEDTLGGRTEWEDILIKKGIRAPKPKEFTEDDLHLLIQEAKEEADLQKHDHKTLEQLDEEEDDIEEDTLEKLRTARKAHLLAEAKRNKFGTVEEIEQQEFVLEVTEASKEVVVITHLYVHGKLDCEILNKHLVILARRHKYAKFLKIVSRKAIPDYPDSECPTLLIYKDGDMAKLLVGIKVFGGPKKISADSMEYRLARLGFLESDMDEDPLINAAANQRELQNNEYVADTMNINRQDFRTKQHAAIMDDPICDDELDDLSDF